MANIKVSNLETSISSITLIKDEEEFLDSVSGAITRALDVRGGAAISQIPIKPITVGIKPIIVGIIYQPTFL
ncbi:MAG: hypothetical protein HC772_02120 [Leptolyngbyaceae cyanobacterium CRU_2_3]|nr:hypothetical protein [Leptolyngbyaceae cyanobacterium CRU_2_3]